MLFALLEGWVDDVAAVASAELVTARTLEQHMAALWRNVSDPAVGNGGQWIGLEHELWSYAYAMTRYGNGSRFATALRGTDWAQAQPVGLNHLRTNASARQSSGS